MPTDLTVWNQGLGLILSIISIVGALASGLGFILGKWRKERQVITGVIQRLDLVTTHLKCVEEQNETRAALAQANLRISFSVAQELVNQGANGELKRAVNELREMVIVNSIPQKAPGLPDDL